MIDTTIAKRKSIRSFDKSELNEEIITSLFEAARRAPSAYNEQPWRFILAKRNNSEEFKSVLETLAEKNREWAINASLLVIVLAKKNLSRNGKFNKHYMYDTASAVANLTFQASSLNLYVHQMGGFSSEIIIERYSVPDEYEPVVVLAIGRKLVSDSEPDEAYPELKRMPLTEIVFENKFGESHSILSNVKELIN